MRYLAALAVAVVAGLVTLAALLQAMGAEPALSACEPDRIAAYAGGLAHAEDHAEELADPAALEATRVALAEAVAACEEVGR